jgi:hypothetical protein
MSNSLLKALSLFVGVSLHQYHKPEIAGGRVVSVVCSWSIHVIQGKFLVLLLTPLIFFNCNPEYYI